MAGSRHDLCREATVQSELGIHARPAARISKIAMTSASAVWLARGEERVDATSIIDILSLGCGKGARLTVAVEDPADRPVLEAIVDLIENESAVNGNG